MRAAAGLRRARAGLRAVVRAGVRAGVLVLAAGGAAAEAPAPSLASIPVEQAGGTMAAAAAAGEALRVRVHAADAAGLARVLGQAPGPAAGAVELRLAPGLLADAGPPAEALAVSFIVDHDEPVVLALRQRLRVELGRADGPVQGAEVEAFVARVVRVAYDANADLASEVAEALKGDCTEHALLTAALARSLGIPARIVHGAALVQVKGRWLAYGHAWVQMFEAGRWVLRDSALASFSGPVVHLPAAVMADEGPGHMLGLMLAYGRLPSRIQVLGPDAAASPLSGNATSPGR